MENYLNKYKNKSGKLSKNTFTRWDNKEISYLPFYHTACRAYRVARYRQGELDKVFEYTFYHTIESCEDACLAYYNYWKEYNEKDSYSNQ